MEVVGKCVFEGLYAFIECFLFSTISACIPRSRGSIEYLQPGKEDILECPRSYNASVIYNGSWGADVQHLAAI